MGEAYLAGADAATEPANRTFHTLDGIRGVAALSVVIWHLEDFRPLQSAYLAVDLFFMLSGFVIAYRYETKLRSGFSVKKFMIMRLIRLYPLYLLGSIIGGAWFLSLMMRGVTAPLYKMWVVNSAFAAFVLPFPLTRGSVFPFNSPSWSLFYEIAVNTIYGFVARWLSDTVLGAVMILSSIALVIASFMHGDLHFNAVMPEFFYASLRALFGFSAGIGLFRLYAAGKLPQIRAPSWAIVALVLLLLAVPHGNSLTPFLTPLAVIVGFPIILVAGVMNEPIGMWSRFMTWSGILSFPLYAVHWPILKIGIAIGQKLHVPEIVAASVAILASLFAAWLALVYFDQPIRHILTVAWKRRTARSNASSLLPIEQPN